MLTITDPLNIENIGNNTPELNKVNSANNAAFSAELESAIKKNTNSKTDKTKKDFKENGLNSGNLLDQLHNFGNINANFSPNEIKNLSQATNMNEQDIASILNQIKNNLMGDIKKSLLNLEDQVNNPENQIPKDLQKQFFQAIKTIKNDFSSGFGVDFNSFNPETNNNTQETELFINKLFANKDNIPKELFIKLQNLTV